jgi:threonine synthase
MVVVQAETCALDRPPAGKGARRMFPNAATVASGLRVPAAVGDFMMIRVLRWPARRSR